MQTRDALLSPPHETLTEPLNQAISAKSPTAEVKKADWVKIHEWLVIKALAEDKARSFPLYPDIRSEQAATGIKFDALFLIRSLFKQIIGDLLESVSEGQLCQLNSRLITYIDRRDTREPLTRRSTYDKLYMIEFTKLARSIVLQEMSLSQMTNEALYQLNPSSEFEQKEATAVHEQLCTQAERAVKEGLDELDIQKAFLQTSSPSLRYACENIKSLFESANYSLDLTNKEVMALWQTRVMQALKKHQLQLTQALQPAKSQTTSIQESIKGLKERNLKWQDVPLLHRINPSVAKTALEISPELILEFHPTTCELVSIQESAASCVAKLYFEGRVKLNELKEHLLDLFAKDPIFQGVLQRNLKVFGCLPKHVQSSSTVLKTVAEGIIEHLENHNDSLIECLGEKFCHLPEMLNLNSLDSCAGVIAALCHHETFHSFFLNTDKQKPLSLNQLPAEALKNPSIGISLAKSYVRWSIHSVRKKGYVEWEHLFVALNTAAGQSLLNFFKSDRSILAILYKDPSSFYRLPAVLRLEPPITSLLIQLTIKSTDQTFEHLENYYSFFGHHPRFVAYCLLKFYPEETLSLVQEVIQSCLQQKTISWDFFQVEQPAKDTYWIDPQIVETLPPFATFLSRLGEKPYTLHELTYEILSLNPSLYFKLSQECRSNHHISLGFGVVDPSIRKELVKTLKVMHKRQDCSQAILEHAKGYQGSLEYLEIANTLLEIDGLLLENMPVSIQSSQELCLTAIKQNAKAISFASAFLLNNSAFAAECVIQNPATYNELPNHIQNSVEVLGALVEIHKDNRDIALRYLWTKEARLLTVSSVFRSDPSFIQEALAGNPELTEQIDKYFFLNKLNRFTLQK